MKHSEGGLYCQGHDCPKSCIKKRWLEPVETNTFSSRFTFPLRYSLNASSLSLSKNQILCEVPFDKTGSLWIIVGEQRLRGSVHATLAVQEVYMKGT